MAGKSRTTLAARLASKLERQPNGCLYFMGSRAKGYGKIGVVGKSPQTTHRVAWELRHGPIPDGLCVLHKCDNRPCCDTDHLFIGTKADNTHDMMAKGREGWHRINRKGEANGRAKISTADACAIYLDKRSSMPLSRHYGISQGQVNNIRRGETWAEATAHLRAKHRD